MPCTNRDHIVGIEEFDGRVVSWLAQDCYDMRVTGAGKNAPNGFWPGGRKGEKGSGSGPVEDADRTIGEGDEDARVVASDDDNVGSARMKRNCRSRIKGKRAIGGSGGKGSTKVCERRERQSWSGGGEQRVG